MHFLLIDAENLINNGLKSMNNKSSSVYLLEFFLYSFAFASYAYLIYTNFLIFIVDAPMMKANTMKI